MMRISFIFPVLIVFALSAPLPAVAGDVPSDDIKQAAKEGMKSFLSVDRIGSLHDQGFDRREDLEKAELGERFEIFTISPKKILNETTSQDLQSLVTSTK